MPTVRILQTVTLPYLKTTHTFTAGQVVTVAASLGSQLLGQRVDGRPVAEAVLDGTSA